jgi:hypothetical protein
MKRDKTSKSTKVAMRHASKQKAANWAMNHQICKWGGDAKIERNHGYQHQEEKEKYYNSLVKF